MTRIYLHVELPMRDFFHFTSVMMKYKAVTVDNNIKINYEYYNKILNNILNVWICNEFILFYVIGTFWIWLIFRLVKTQIKFNTGRKLLRYKYMMRLYMKYFWEVYVNPILHHKFTEPKIWFTSKSCSFSERLIICERDINIKSW